MTSKLVAVVFMAVVVGFLWVRNCSGPDPVVTGVRLVEPHAEATPYRVEATVRNRRDGEGQAQITVRLRDQSSGRTVQEQKNVNFASKETTLVVVDVDAPAGSYKPEVDASYPPQ